MRINLKEKMAYPSGANWRLPSTFAEWDRLLKHRHASWTIFSPAERRVAADRLNALVAEGVPDQLAEFASSCLQSKLGLQGTRVLNVSVNGSYLSEVSPAYHSQDIDATVVVESPPVALDIPIDPPIVTGAGYQLRDIGLVGTERFARFTAHPKVFSELLSHLSGGVPLAGGYFSAPPVAKRFFLMHALRLAFDGLGLLSKGAWYEKAAHRLSEARRIVALIGGEPCVSELSALHDRLELYRNADQVIRGTLQHALEQEISRFIRSAGTPLKRSGVKVHPNLPFDPPELNFDDWARCRKVIRKPVRTADDVRLIWQFGDNDAMLMFDWSTCAPGKTVTLTRAGLSAVEEQIAAVFTSSSESLAPPRLKDPADPKWQAIREVFISFRPDQKILDVGCGRGRYLKALAEEGKQVTGLEISDEFVAQLKRQGKNVVNGSVSKTPFADNCFDGVLCAEVLEHTKDLKSALREMHRVVKERGVVLILDKSKYGFHHHHRKFYPYLLEKLVKEKITDQWMYKNDFPFTERRFGPWRLKKWLSELFRQVDMNFIPYDATPENIVCKTLPFLRQMVVWECHK